MTLLKFAPRPVHRRRTIQRPVFTQMTTPKVNIIEKDDAFLLELAIPGVPKNLVTIDVKEDQLIIELPKQETEEPEKINYLRKEYGYTEFKKVFNLTDDINQSAIDASLENGILTITLEKKEEAKGIPPKTITIK